MEVGADRTAFVICTEEGLLERKSIALVETLRSFGGRFADCPILSYSPREGRAPKEKTLRFFSRANVQVIDEPLNREYAEYGFGNKLIACAHAERRHPRDRLVFLDSDMLVYQEPEALWTTDSRVVKLRPVERKLIGSTGRDENAPYWKRLFDWAGISDPAYVETTLSGERIHGYWNAGVISASVRSSFFGRWLSTFRDLIAEGLVHPRGMTFMDQVALAMTVQRSEFRVEHLPEAYNVPVNSLADLDVNWEDHEAFPDPRSVVIAHYHRAFDHYPLGNPLGDWMPPAKRDRLERILRRSGLMGPVNWFRHRLHHRLGWEPIAP